MSRRQARGRTRRGTTSAHIAHRCERPRSTAPPVRLAGASSPRGSFGRPRPRPHRPRPCRTRFPCLLLDKEIRLKTSPPGGEARFARELRAPRPAPPATAPAPRPLATGPSAASAFFGGAPGSGSARAAPRPPRAPSRLFQINPRSACPWSRGRSRLLRVGEGFPLCELLAEVHQERLVLVRGYFTSRPGDASF